MLTLAPITPETSGFAALLSQSLAEGHRMLQRLEQDWRSGANRFDELGEFVVGATRNGELLGICGRNIDPYDPASRAGRVRHLYVAPASRGSGVGRFLITAICADASQYFDYLNTNAPAEASAFYLRLGFLPISDVARVTHRLWLR